MVAPKVRKKSGFLSSDEEDEGGLGFNFDSKPKQKEEGKAD